MGLRLALRRRWLEWTALLLLAATAAGPLLFNGGFLSTRGGGDSPFLLFRLHQLAAALADGHFPVRWMPDAAYGMGYPFFSYYAALPFYLAAGLHFWGLGLIAAVKLTQWLGFVLAAGASWGLVHHFSRSRPAAWLAAVAYTFAPYHLVNVYVRGDSLTEFWAMGLYPLALWLAARVWDRPGRGRLVAFAAGYAALVLTHNISALIFSPFLLLFVLLLAAGRRWRRAGWLGLGLLLGLALSAWFWLPALAEQGAVQLAAQTSGYFHYSNHFRPLGLGAGQLVQPGWAFDYDPAGGNPFAMGLVQAVLLVAGLLSSVWQWRTDAQRLARPLNLFALLALLVSTGMMLPASRLIWDYLPLLPMVQFPWRFLSVQALAASILIGQIADWQTRSVRPHPFSRPVIVTLLCLVILLSALVGLRPDFVALSTADITPEQLQLYEWFSGNVGTTIRSEYLPQDVVPRPYTSEGVIAGRSAARMLMGQAAADLQAKRTGRERWSVDVQPDGATVAFPIHYWPGWRAEVDGRPAPVFPADSLGWLTVDLPAGEHSVEFRLGRTPLRLVAELVSLFALVGCAAWLARAACLAAHSTRVARHALRLAAAVLIIGLLLRLLPQTPPAQDDLTWDFAQQAYQHHNPAGVRFDQAAVMQGYNYPDAMAGEALSATVRWSQIARPGLQAELALVHPAEVVQNVPHTLAADRRPVEQETAFYLVLPDWMPPGPLLLRLRLFDADGRSIPALTSAGQARGDLYLRPVWGPESAAGTATAGLVLDGVQREQLDPEHLAVTPGWQVGEPMHANLGLALRLHDAAGTEWAALDTQPGYGFYPTSAWPAGSSVLDRLVLDLPYGTPPGEYTLTVTLYDVGSLQPRWGPQTVGVRLTEFAPYDGRPLAHQFLPALAVAGVTATETAVQGEPFQFSVAWVALEELSDSLVGRWQLVGRDGELETEGELMLGPWPAGSLVLGRETVRLDPQLPPGEYRLMLAVPGALPWQAVAITVTAAARQFELPPIEVPVGAEYGGLLRLEGYDLGQTADALALTLHWRALAPIPADYIVFVHLFDPANEQIPVQSDAMPRANSYPTSRWAGGEVVSDPITLSLHGVPPGDYRLGVGLYRVEGDQYPRLPAVDATGEPVAHDRVVLSAEVQVP